MTRLPIVIAPDPVLTIHSELVTDVSDSLRQLAEDMVETMYAARGVGLAAPQVAQHLRLIVMDCHQREDEDGKPAQRGEPLVLLNPRIVTAATDLRVYEEGCLSIPEQSAEVTRPEAVRVAWLDLAGNEQERDFEELEAVCVQHEIDHLDGILFTDHLSRIKRSIILRKSAKIKKEQGFA